MINTDPKSINKILTNQIKQHIKKIIHNNQVGFIPGSQWWFNICKSINVIHHINQRTKTHDHLSQWMQKKHLIKFNIHLWLKKKTTLTTVAGTYLDIIKPIYDKSIANIIFNNKKLKAFPLNSRTRQCTPLPPLSFFFFFFLAAPHGLWDLSSPTRDYTQVHGSESTET